MDLSNYWDTCDVKEYSRLISVDVSYVVNVLNKIIDLDKDKQLEEIKGFRDTLIRLSTPVKYRKDVLKNE